VNATVIDRARGDLYARRSSVLRPIRTVADIMNPPMAISNLIALVALSSTVFAVSRACFAPGGGTTTFEHRAE